MQRPLTFGDPDDPDAMPLDIPAATARTAAALASQSGIQTSADHQAQRPRGTTSTPGRRPVSGRRGTPTTAPT